MKILKILLGIAVICAGIYCVVNPAVGTLTICWIMAVLLLVLGLCSICEFAWLKKKENIAGKYGVYFEGSSIGCLVIGILAIVISILAMTSEEGRETFFYVISVLFGLTVIVMGIYRIVHACFQKRMGLSVWVATLILGILILIFGIACIFNSFYTMAAIGTIMGLEMLLVGISILLPRETAEQ